MAWLISLVAHLLMGGAFIGFGVRNIGNVPRLSGILEKKNVQPAVRIVQAGVGLQLVGAVLTVLGEFVPVLGVLGGLAMIVFLVLATLLFHPAWEFPAEERYAHTTAVLMNSCLVGGFLLIILMGL